MASTTALFVISLVALCLFSAEAFVSSKLVKFLDKTGRLEPDVFPQKTLDQTVNVTVGLSLDNIHKVDTETNSVHLDLCMDLKWDSGITFNSKREGGLEVIRLPASKMWRPDLDVYNGDLTLTPNSLSDRIVLYSSGQAAWIAKAKVRVVCNVSDDSLTASNTTCAIRIGSWTHNGHELRLDDQPYFLTVNYDDQSSFEVLEVSAIKESKTFNCCPEPYESVLFTFTFRKK